MLNTNEAIGARVTQVIADLGITSNKFATQEGVDASFLSKMEKGKVPVSKGLKKLLTEKYNVNPQWLEFGTGQKYGEDYPNQVNEPVAPYGNAAADILAMDLPDSEKITLLAEKLGLLTDQNLTLRKLVAGNEKYIALLEKRLKSKV